MLFVPDNVYVLATANTSDRSIAPFDAALRRRFAFERLEPDMPGAVDLENRGADEHLPELLAASRMLESLNESVLRPCIGPDALLGHSYVYAAAEGLKAGTSSGSADSVLERTWRYAILPQLIDIARSFGAEDVLDLQYRPAWFSNHSELEGSADLAQSVLGELDGYLRGFGMKLRVEGIGLARGARVTSDFELPIPDLMFNPDQ
jgi:5-methylcytosine-specific restriction endonuclease McrBC GTP-binding regulatory subunit McrB